MDPPSHNCSRAVAGRILNRGYDVSAVPSSYVDYLWLFYCLCAGRPLLGYAALSLALALLFYLLGDTASRYFCSSLHALSRLLRLSPSVAGVTLLALGNGAPDVLSSLVSFTSTATAGVGIGSVLGGGLFVTTVVVGVISLSSSPGRKSIQLSSFVRDACFYLVVVFILLAVVVKGSVSPWESISMVCLYLLYIFLACRGESGGSSELADPLLSFLKGDRIDDCPPPPPSRYILFLKRLRWAVETLLDLPRRMTIPDVSEERWSRSFAVASASLAPILLAGLLNSDVTFYFVGVVAGMVTGAAAVWTTEPGAPPAKCLLPWVAGGFVMSVVWAYITARELVALLVSIGMVLGISPSVLAVTVLAWGNSVGDLTANVAMAVGGGRGGAKVAVAGCYAGPIFSTLVGLGTSLVVASWREGAVVIPGRRGEFETLVFLIAGLVWALLVLPRRGMKMDRTLGVGLLAIYLCFLSLRISDSLGLLDDFRVF